MLTFYYTFSTQAKNVLDLIDDVSLFPNAVFCASGKVKVTFSVKEAGHT